MNFFFRTFLALGLSTALLHAEDTPTADALWSQTDAAIKALMKPSEQPGSREEIPAWITKLITAADTAGKKFTDQYPHDPRRWRIRIFEAITASARAQLGLPRHGDLDSILKEVLAAPDADAVAKGQASAVTVLLADPADPEAWLKLAGAHLQKYPEEEMNAEIKEKVATFKMLAELKTKPLDIKFKAVDGREVDLAQMRGKVVLIDFWATWCGPCVAEMPHVIETYEKLHSRGFEIVGISLDSDKEKLESFTAEQKMPWPQYFDGKSWENEIASKYGIHAIPAMWLVDKKGMLVSMQAQDQLEELVEKHLGE